MWIRVSVQSDPSMVLQALSAAGRQRSLDRPLATSAIFEVNSVDVISLSVFTAISYVCLSLQPFIH